MSQSPFVSLDARWLWELSQRLPDDMLADVVRLAEIAGRHERLDEQVRNLTAAPKGDGYAQGALDMAAKIYGRSNLPVGDRTPQVELNKAVERVYAKPGVEEINGVKVKKIPRGISAFVIEPEKPKVSKPKAPNPKLAGLTLNLSLLTKKAAE